MHWPCNANYGRAPNTSDGVAIGRNGRDESSRAEQEERSQGRGDRRLEELHGEHSVFLNECGGGWLFPENQDAKSKETGGSSVIGRCERKMSEEASTVLKSVGT